MSKSKEQIDDLNTTAEAVAEERYAEHDTNIEKELIEALEVFKAELPSRPAIEVTNHSYIAKKYLSDKALKALQKKATNLTVIENGQTYLNVSLGVTVRYEGLEEGIRRVCSKINSLAEQGVIHSCLTPVSSIALFREALTQPSSAVFCMVLVPDNIVQEIAKDELCFGEVPKGGPFKMAIPDGTVYAVDYITYAGMMRKDFNKEVHLKEIVDTYLAVLPKDTQFAGWTEVGTGFTGLSVSFELKFTNTLFKTIKRVDFQYVRHVEVVGEGKLEQFNVLIGVDYYDEFDKLMFQPLKG